MFLDHFVCKVRIDIRIDYMLHLYLVIVSSDIKLLTFLGNSINLVSIVIVRNALLLQPERKALK